VVFCFRQYCRKQNTTLTASLPFPCFGFEHRQDRHGSSGTVNERQMRQLAHLK